MRRNDPISVIMTTPAFALTPATPVQEARRLLDEHAFHHVPICDGQALVGIVSTLDLSGAQPDDAVARVMSTPVVTILADATVRNALDLLSGAGFSALPVVGPSGALCGIVTAHDLEPYISDEY